MTATATIWIVLAIVSVWTTEALNTAIEFLTDVASPTFHPVAGKAKDVAAGAVLIAAIGAIIIGALVGYTSYIWLLRVCDPAKVATYAYVNPIVAVLLGALFAGETLTARTMIAAVLIIGSVALVITVQQTRSKPMLVDAAFVPGD